MTSTPDLTLAAIKMILALALVLGLLWGLHRLVRRKLPYGQNTTQAQMVRVLESRYLGPKKSIALVQVPGALLVLGLGAEQVNLLSRVDDPDTIATLTSKSVEKNRPNFLSLFQRATDRQSLETHGPNKPAMSLSDVEL